MEETLLIFLQGEFLQCSKYRVLQESEHTFIQSIYAEELSAVRKMKLFLPTEFIEEEQLKSILFQSAGNRRI